ncbi:hypothetical protein AB835_07190 [Candidatus Endobugula sertula]|uniref:histidine kinase n=1 Tax=Candidatus Endobugula sertula TaxID=62101 RepID=A0A1D2QQ98_9GAMM|nr:hypothetical protein AB835_07190 [Candidatus Endobugula sertula]
MNSLKDIKWYDTVKTKMISLLILTMMAVMVIAGFYSFKYIQKLETGKLTTFANLSADRLSKSLETPMWNIDREHVSELLNTEMAEKVIVGLVVTDEGDKGVFSSKTRGPSGEIIDSASPFADSGNKHIIQVNRSITHDNKNIGSLDVYITDKYLDEELVNFAFAVVIVIAILALAIFLLMNILLNRIVINPLLELADSADAISRGELNQAFDIGSKDEIGYLGESFKKMQISLRIAMNRLSEPSETPAPTAPERKSTFSMQILQDFLQEIRAAGRMPSLTSIFKFASSRKTVPDDLVSVAWKEWNHQQQGQSR